MAVTATSGRGGEPSVTHDGAALVGRADDWPHTRRVLPWAIAGFLAMLWLVPFDAIDLPVRLPVDSKLDRLALVALAALWLVSQSRFRTRSGWLSTPAVAGMLLFTALAVTSVIANLGDLAWLGDLEISTKRVAHLLSFILFFAIVVTTVRPTEARAFLALLVGLAAIAAVATVYEYRTTVNLFFDWAGAVLPDAVSVDSPPADPRFGRENVTGPTAHGLAIATMLSIALPFAVAGVMTSRHRRERLLYAVAVALIVAGSVATLRKTSFVAPAAGLIILLAYRPRHMARLVPLGAVVMVLVLALAPGAAVRVKAQFVNNLTDRNTTVGRTSDYSAVNPDVAASPVLGRGFGSYDPEKYRILDNEFLALLIETGALGVVAYIGMILGVILTAHPAIRRWDPVRGPPALAAAGGAAAYGISNLLFDSFAFPQAPYMFFFAAGLGVVCAAEMWPRGQRDPTAGSALDIRGAQPIPVGAGASPISQASAKRRAEQPVVPRSSLLYDMTVIIVTHNGREKALATMASARASLGSVTAQWLVVDSGSTDGTPEALASRWPDVRLIRRPNIGFAAGNNVGLAEARGRYVLLLNPDVEIVEGTFGHLVAAMDARPSVGAASVIQRAPDGRLQYSIRRFPSARRRIGEALFSYHWPFLSELREAETRPRCYRLAHSADWLVGALLLVRRETIEDVGPLDERFFLYSEEIDWCRRIHAAGWDIRHIPVMTVIHHLGGRPLPALKGQLTHSKILYASKHLNPAHALAVRASLVIQHALRLVLAAPLTMGSKRWRVRARGEALALALALGLYRDADARLRKQLAGS